ncbi:MAG: efflux transporter outer membrane subunit [Planctomycetaceae bacterium]|nr:efflux transporter outer membrane subunit [Planctomycetaceae bacterium]
MDCCRILLWGLVVSVVMHLTGCAPVGPNYTSPETSVTSDWHSQLKRGLTSEQSSSETLTSWWTTLNDAELSKLIEQAVQGNLDLKSARSRVRQARAQRGIASADLFPSLDFTGSKKWTRSSEAVGTGETTHTYSTNFDAGWEIDVFGGVRRSIESADASLQSSKEDLRDVMVTLISEVALNYTDVRIYQARITVVNENLKAQQETYELILWRNQAGLSDDLAVQQALYNLESTRAEIPDLNTGLEEAKNRIAVLLGEQPGKIHSELEPNGIIPVSSPKVAIGVPADVLRRRPDIRRAERDLAAQTAKVGVATADLYPKFSLTGSIGVEAVSSSRLGRNIVNANNWTLIGGPQISWAIFDAGAIRQNIKVQSELQEQALIDYESAVLTAVEEVENAIVAYANEQDKMESLDKATQAAQSAVGLAKQEYEAGLTDFSDVLDAQRSLLSFQNQLTQSRGNVTVNLIKLYKALGGGWTSLASDEKLADSQKGKK